MQKQNQDFFSASRKPDEHSGVSHPQVADPAQLLQRSLGNDYLQKMTSSNQTVGTLIALTGGPRIQRACACGGTCGNCSDKEDELRRIQTKLTISQPGDIYEQEADRVAEQVMRMPDSSGQPEKVHPYTETNIQRIGSNSGATLESTSDIQLSESGGHPLSPSTRQYMEPRFGVDFGHVRLHSDDHAHRTASQIQARAFTYGHHIWLGRGESDQDKSLMAHELTHTIQQNHGRNQSHSKTGDMIQRLPFGIRLPSGARGLDPAHEEPILRGVYGSSLNYGDIYLSDALGGGGRPFTLHVPFVGTIIQIGPSAYSSPGSNPKLLIHEAAHSWQSQHHFDRTQFMGNSLASQAAASAAGGDAYCFIPGKSFGDYAAEQIANQAEKGLAPITAHMRSVSAGSVDLANIASLSIPRWETPSAPGVVC